MKWTEGDELQLLLLALAAAPNFAPNAEMIHKAWPKDREVPTVRAIRDRFNLVKKRVPGAKLRMSGGTAPDKRNGTITPATRNTGPTDPLTPPTTTSTPAAANDPAAIFTPASKTSFTSTPFKVSNLQQSLAAAQNPTTLLPKSKFGSTAKKRTRSVLSDDEDEAEMTENTTSEEESPSKKAKRSPSLASRRSSRRSASAKPKYRFEQDGSGEDEAAKEIDTEDEWNESAEDEKTKKVGAWREEYGLKQEPMN